MKELDVSQVDEAAHLIENGGLVIVPTPRWYMICCDAGDADACLGVYEAKQRPRSKSLLLALSEGFPVENYFNLNRATSTLMRHFWPGDLAFRLRWKTQELAALRSGGKGCSTCRPAIRHTG